MIKIKKFISELGVYGFDDLEPFILASLVSEDPILLIGKAGTGKTFLLNSISEALKLEHRHYNASLISFDDLIGFPYPSEDKRSITFLPTPATIWEAESVLVDELSRCKPETQNKFFSIIHERKIQGLELKSLRFRWAAMNPFLTDADPDEYYEGTQALDQALADRFAFIFEVPDWLALTATEQKSVIYPAGEFALSNDQGRLGAFIAKVHIDFLESIKNPLPEIVSYSRLATTFLNEAGFRVSPRRARALARNLTAVICVVNSLGRTLSIKDRQDLYKQTLNWSLPHRAWKGNIPQHVLDSVHSEIIRLVFKANESEAWISEFLLRQKLSDKVDMLFSDSVNKDTRSLAVIQLLGRESKSRAAAFAFAVFPLLQSLDLLHEDAISELGALANLIFNIDGTLEWKGSAEHPQWTECLQYVEKMSAKDEKRKKRAKQLFLYLTSVAKNKISDMEIVETELNDCFLKVQHYASVETSSSEIRNEQTENDSTQVPNEEVSIVVEKLKNFIRKQGFNPEPPEEKEKLEN